MHVRHWVVRRRPLRGKPDLGYSSLNTISWTLMSDHGARPTIYRRSRVVGWYTSTQDGNQD